MRNRTRICRSGVMCGWVVAALVGVAVLSPAVARTEVTSRNNRRLRDALKQYPAADANRDGVLTADEARAYVIRMADGRGGQDKGAADGGPKPPAMRKTTGADGMTTITNATYGSHSRHVMDLWLPKSDKPTPIVMYIHGGGFVAGDKSHGHRQPLRKRCLAAKVAFATMNYRFKSHATFQEIMYDGARAIQAIRASAKQLNVDPRRIGVYGSSAGAIMSLWLAFHPDVGDRRSKDPTLRYASTVAVAGGLMTPTGTESLALRYASAGDPPIFQYNAIPFSKTRDVHHPSHAVAVKKRCDQLRIPSVLLLKDGPTPFKGDPVAAQAAFFFKYLGVTEKEKVKG